MCLYIGDDCVMSKVTITVLFFGQARELAKLNKTTTQVPQNLFGYELRSIIVDQYNLSSIENIFVLAINEIYKSDNLHIILQENDVLAIIPPISGGNNHKLVMINIIISM